MIITNQDEIKTCQKYMRLAAKEATKSKCAKSQRGVIIVKNGKVIGKGYNKPTIEKLCHPCIRENIKNNGQVELCSAIHAEQMAIINSKESLKSARMYHIKVKDGEMKPSSDISCTVCSRIILESGIKEFVLWHKEGYGLYSANEFNRLSFKYFLH